MNKTLPKVGDVIISEKFAFGYYSTEEQLFVNVDGQTKKHTLEVSIDEEERVENAAKTGAVPSKKRVVEMGAYAPSRGSAKFVVEAANFQGGCGVYSSDGWHIVARRLDRDGKYNPTGELIKCYVTGFFTNKVEEKDIKIIGKMKMIFV